MESSVQQFRKDYIGNIRFEFFTIHGSLTIEAWRSTRVCRVTTYCRGLRRRTEIVLTEDQWWKLVVPISYSGFWKWNKRYDSHAGRGYAPSWSTSFMTKQEWYYSSGDGEFPEGFTEMLSGLARFAAEVEQTDYAGVGSFLDGYLADTEA